MYSIDEAAAKLGITSGQLGDIVYQDSYSDEDLESIRSLMQSSATTGTKKSRKTKSVQSKSQSSKKSAPAGRPPINSNDLTNKAKNNGAGEGLELYLIQQHTALTVYEQLNDMTARGELHPNPQLAEAQLSVLERMAEIQEKTRSDFFDYSDGTFTFALPEVTLDDVADAIEFFSNGPITAESYLLPESKQRLLTSGN